MHDDHVTAPPDTTAAGLDMFPGLVCRDVMTVALDHQGRIVSTCATWSAAARRRSLEPDEVGAGIDYLDVCDRAIGPGSDLAWRAAHGIRSVIAGATRSFILDYPCHGPNGQAWFSMRVRPAGGAVSGGVVSGGVVVSHAEITHVMKAEQSLRGETASLWKLAAPDAEFVTLLGLDGSVVAGVPNHEAVVGDRPWYGESIFEVIHSADQQRAAVALEECLTVPGSSVELAVRVHNTDGQWRSVEIVGQNMVDDPEVGGVVVSGRDLTDMRRIQVAHLLWERFVHRLPTGVVVTDDLGIVHIWNEHAEGLFGVAADKAVGRPINEVLGPAVEETFAVAAAEIAAGRRWEGEHEVSNDGRSRVLWVQLQPLVDEENGFNGVLAIAVDRTEHRDLRDLLDHTSSHDTLTGVLNRPRFVEELETRLRSDRSEGVVAVVSLDKFRSANLALGPARADDILRAVASCLERTADRDMVARLHGDVFALVVTTTSSPMELGDSLCRSIAQLAEGEEYELTASVGLRAIERGEDDAMAVIEAAFEAVADVKMTGGRGSSSFEPALRDAALERLALERDLRRAIERRLLSVEYQPIVRLSDGMVSEVEALVRWHDPDRGTVPPDRFIPTAERSGAIDDIFKMVLEDACRSIGRWQTARPEIPVSVAINLSASQLRDPGLARQVAAEIRRASIDPSLLTIELTESMLMEDDDWSNRQLAELKTVGVRLAIDDFGTGHSSLARLKSMPLDILKIDRSFVEFVASRPEDASIVETIASLAECFGLDVVAEGIETPEQQDVLTRLGCMFGQGYLWSHAIPPEEIDRFLTGTQPTTTSPAGQAESFGSSECSDVLLAVRHELATPLAVISRSVDLLDQGPVGTDQAAALERLRAGVARIDRITRTMDLLHLLDRGSLTVVPAAIRPIELVELAIADINPGTSRTFDLIVSEGIEDMLLDVDAVLLTQAIDNVLTNAVKYSPPTTSVTVSLSLDAGELEISVADCGPGLTPRQLSIAWRKFGRLDQSAAGSGLGLYLARGIARAHRGDLRYRANPCGGSDFFFRIPIG